MAQARISLSAVGYEEWRRLARNLRGAPNDLRSELRQKIRDAAKPVLEEVKQAALEIPVTSRGGGGSRRQLYNSLQAGRRAHKRGGDVRAAIERGARRPHSLRRSIASATKLQATARGVRFVVDSGNLPESQRTLPRHLDSSKGWRHPVFGNREEWVHQQGRPYFGRTISRRAVEFRKAVFKAMEETANKIQN